MPSHPYREILPKNFSGKKKHPAQNLKIEAPASEIQAVKPLLGDENFGKSRKHWQLQSFFNESRVNENYNGSALSILTPQNGVYWGYFTH